jgi:hypothetical protein
MIRFLLRALGLLLLALAFIFVIYDGIKSIADSAFYATALSQFWIEIHAASLQAFQAAVTRWLGDTVWKVAVQPILNQPAAALFAGLGVLLIILGRKKRPLIGYARD